MVSKFLPSQQTFTFSLAIIQSILAISRLYKIVDLTVSKELIMYEFEQPLLEKPYTCMIIIKRADENSSAQFRKIKVVFLTYLFSTMKVIANARFPPPQCLVFYWVIHGIFKYPYCIIIKIIVDFLSKVSDLCSYLLVMVRK